VIDVIALAGAVEVIDVGRVHREGCAGAGSTKAAVIGVEVIDVIGARDPPQNAAPAAPAGIAAAISHQ
jgi:hypothetical protein